MFKKPISVTGQQEITSASPALVSTVVVQVSGITADSGSMTPQLRIAMEGVSGTPPSWVNTTYLNQATGATVAAGTAITADGIYEFSTNGCQLGMNVTAVTAGYTLYVTPLEGPSGMSSGSGGSGGAVTLASGAVASGAYAAGSIASGAAVSGAFVDGAITTLGTEADTAVGDATGTVNAHVRQVAKSLAGTLTTTGTDADNAANSTTKVPVIPARANAAAQTWTEGHEVPLSTDLSGALRVNLTTDSTTSAGSKSTVAQVTVTSSATLILAANTARKSLAITNQGTATIYLGNSGVTTSTGFALAAGATVSDVTTTDAWYGIVASTSMTAGVIEVS